MAMNKREKGEIAELRGELQSSVGELRGELQSSVGELRGELRSSVGELRGELRNSVGELRGELRNSVEELRIHMGVLVEGLHSEVRVIAEQYGSVVNRLDRVDAKLVEHDGRFDKMDLQFQRVHIDLKAITAGLFDTSHRVDDHETRIRKLEVAKK
jgi:chromosome segregation ATPase